MYDSHADSASKVRYISSKEPSVYRDPHFFREPVETRLPYLEITTKAAYNYSGLMIDGERIVGISVSCYTLTSHSHGSSPKSHVALSHFTRSIILMSSLIQRAWSDVSRNDSLHIHTF